MTRRPVPPGARRGFTLVEAVMVIAIIGIIGAIVAVFIRAPILSYRDTVDRAELTDQADLALRRMARDIRLALPNSVRVSAAGDHLELLQTRSGARYLAAEDGTTSTQVLSFDDASKTRFTALMPPKSFEDVRVGDFVVVYNLGPGLAPADAYGLAATGDSTGNVGGSANTSSCPGASPVTAEGNIARICALDPPQTAIDKTVVDPVVNMPVRYVTLAGNPFALQATPLQSPPQRFQVISGPLSFYCAASTDGRLALWRAWGYPITATQAVPTAGKRALVATGLTSCSDIFSYGTAASQRTGLVRIALGLRGRADNPAAIRLVHQVHVDNTP
jgi:MSHA biogenesis protein MshO